MGEIQEIIVADGIDAVESWIENFSIGVNDNAIFLIPDDGKRNQHEASSQLKLFSGKKYMVVHGPPYKEPTKKRNQFYIKTSIGTHQEVNDGGGSARDYLILTTSSLDETHTNLYINRKQAEISPYILELFRGLLKKWPETERSIFPLLPSPYRRNPQTQVFNLSISANPRYFAKWLDETCKRLLLSDKIVLQGKNNIITEVADCRLYPPDNRYRNYLELLIIAKSTFKSEPHTKDLLTGIDNIASWVIGRIESKDLGDNNIDILCYMDFLVPEFEEKIKELEINVRMTFPEINKNDLRPDNVSARIEARAMVFSRLKKENPHWTMARLALEATDVLGEIVTAETVRNVYRLKGWTWVRGDRTR